MLLLARFKIYGHSMEPQIGDGEEVLVSEVPFWFKKPQINDIVAFVSKDNKVLIKRVSGVVRGGYYVQGDNREDSLDSRRFGKVLPKQIMGKFIFKL